MTMLFLNCIIKSIEMSVVLLSGRFKMSVVLLSGRFKMGVSLPNVMRIAAEKRLFCKENNEMYKANSL